MPGTNPTIQRLVDANPLRAPLLYSAVQGLHLPDGSRGLDLGCGIGLQAMLLADAVGPRGHVTGVDLDPELLAFGEDLIGRAGYAQRITLREADARYLPFAENAFDWVWSADCIGYPVGDLPVLLRELMRVVRPGGSVVVLAWSSQRVLPGHPLLEDRLNAVCSSYAPYLSGKNPDQHFLRALRWFREAGLEEVQVRTLVGDARAPLAPGERVALAGLFEMLWDVSSEDRGEYLRLCAPESPDFILNEPGYYAFFTYTLFHGKLPRRD